MNVTRGISMSIQLFHVSILVELLALLTLLFKRRARCSFFFCFFLPMPAAPVPRSLTKILGAFLACLPFALASRFLSRTRISRLLPRTRLIVGGTIRGDGLRVVD